MRISCSEPAEFQAREHIETSHQQAKPLAHLCFQSSHMLVRDSWQRSPWETTCPPRKGEEPALSGVLPHNRSYSKLTRDRRTRARRRERHWWRSATGEGGAPVLMEEGKREGWNGPLCALAILPEAILYSVSGQCGSSGLRSPLVLSLGYNLQNAV